MKKVAGFVEGFDAELIRTEHAVKEFTNDAKNTRKQWNHIKATQKPESDAPAKGKKSARRLQSYFFLG